METKVYPDKYWELYDARERAREALENATPAERDRLLAEYLKAVDALKKWKDIEKEKS